VKLLSSSEPSGYAVMSGCLIIIEFVVLTDCINHELRPCCLDMKPSKLTCNELESRLPVKSLVFSCFRKQQLK
jgi:hypothetical protein